MAPCLQCGNEDWIVPETGLCESCHDDVISGRLADEDGCYTLPNGECIGLDCIHGKREPRMCECGGFIDLNIHYTTPCKGESK